IYFWPDPVHALAEIRRVSTPEDMAKAPFTPYGFRVYDEAQLRQFYIEAGFLSVDIERYRDTAPSLDRTGITERENIFVFGVAWSAAGRWRTNLPSRSAAVEKREDLRGRFDRLPGKRQVTRLVSHPRPEWAVWLRIVMLTSNGTIPS